MKRLALVLAVAVGLPVTAAAHYPVCACTMKDASTVRCEGGFSDGTPAPGVPVEVIAYDEQVIVRGVTDETSGFEFARPSGEFFVLFDAGPGHVVEIDHPEIR